MDIDFEFYLNCPDMLDTVVTNIRDFEQETLGEEMQIYNDPPSKEDEFIDMNCSLYCVSVTSIELFPVSLWLEESYHVDVTVNINFWFYTGGDYALKAGHVLRLFLVLSRLYPGDAILFHMDNVIYRKNEAGIYMDDGKSDNEDYFVKLFEQERKRKRDGVSLPFQFRTLVFPAGEDCLSIDFDQGYELLTAFLVFEAVNAYPTIYKALTAVLNQRSDCKEIGLNVCSLEIHSDTTKILDDFAGDGKERFCEIATEELLFLIQIWADELDMRLRRISREELKAELDEIEAEQREVENEIKQQEIEKQERERQEAVVVCKNAELYDAKVEIAGMPERADGNYPTPFSAELTQQEIADTIREAYGNKVGIIENAYMGRAKNGMKIALFLSDAGKILRAFPLC